MSQKVEVLCPNGHRVPVKISPNTKVLQILEEACKKQGFNPPSDYEIKHGRTSLDVTLSVRYAGIPNLAKLELVKASKSRAETKVTIALQILSGERIQSDFDPGTTIWQILRYWESQPNSQHAGKLTQCSGDNVHPTCTYMREEVIGQYGMEHTTLRSLGLTGGKAMLRLQHRCIQPELLEKVQSKIQKEIYRQEKIAEKAAKIQEENKSKEALLTKSKERILDVVQEKEDISGDQMSASESCKSETAVNKSRKQETTELLFPSGSSSSSSSSNSNAQPQQEEPMEVIYTSGTRPKTQDVQQNQETNSHPSAAMLFFPGTDTNEHVQLTPQQEAIAQSLAKAINPGMLKKKDTEERARLRDERIRNRPPAPSTRHQQIEPNYAEFKFPEATKGQDLYRNELSDVNKEEFKPCDRETVIYRLDEVSTKNSEAEEMETDEIPEDFFEVTEKDVKNMWMDTQKQMKELEEQQLMTKAMRLADKEIKMSQYQRVVIRFVFPGQVAIQGLFRPKETVHVMQKFIKEFLEDKSQDFYLYTTPPKCVLKDRSSTLIEADLAPMSVVYFGSEVKKENIISTAVIGEISTEAKAYEILVKYMPKPTLKSENANVSRAHPSASRAASNTAASGKVPKWFKLGKR